MKSGFERLSYPDASMQLGTGLGAGTVERARQAAMEILDGIKEMLNSGTVWSSLRPEWGGGTGTGAAPVILPMCQGNGYPDGRYRDLYRSVLRIEENRPGIGQGVEGNIQACRCVVGYQ